MIFEYLYIKDFMKIKEVEFNLESTNMVILQGGNGHGKSAVFEAMAMLMIGHRKGSSFKHYIRRGTKQFKVKARIVKAPGKNPYDIDIVCSHKTMPPMNKSVTYNGETYRNSDYDTFMRDHFDADLIDNVVLSMQGTNDLSKFKPSQLRDLLTRVFKISFEREKEHVHSLASYAREREKALENQIASLSRSLDILKRDEPILTRPPSEKKLQDLRQEYDRKKKELEKKEQSVHVLDDLSKRISTLQKEAQDQRALLDHYRKDYNRVDKQLQEAREQIQQYKDQKESIQTELKQLSSQEEAQRIIDDAWDKMSELKGQRHNLEHILELVDEGTCPTCKQELPSDWKDNSDEYKKRLQETDTRINELDQQVKEVSDQINKVIRKENELTNKEYNLKVLNHQIVSLEEKFDDLDKNTPWDDLNKTISDKEEEVKTLQVHYAQKEKELQNDIEDKDALVQECQRLSSLLESQTAAFNDYKAKAEILKDNYAKKAEIEKQLQDLRDQDVETHKQKEVREVAEKLVDKYLPTFGVLTAGEKVVKGMHNIITPVLPEWHLRLVPSRDGVYFEYTEGDEEEWSPISLSSGFENALCAIAFKLTLAAYYGLPLMILDEIDAAAVDENSYKVFDSINQFKKVYGIHQIWLVSHKSDVVNQLVQEYGDQVQVYNVHNGEFTHSWIGGATQ